MQTETTHESDQRRAHWYADEARAVERDLVDRINASTFRHEKTERRVKQVQLAIESDLFVELDTDGIDHIRSLAASVRVKHRMLMKQLTEAQRIADQCDEMFTLYQTAERLPDGERSHQCESKLEALLGDLHSIDVETKIVCDLLARQEQDQLAIFEQIKR